MKIHKKEINFESTKQVDFIDITADVQEIVSSSGIREGQVLIFAQHTTLGVAINHNESMLTKDFSRVLERFSPMDESYSHDLFELKSGRTKSDGRSNGHSHCKSFLVGNSEVVPVGKGKLLLSDLQSIFAIDFDGARKRNILVQVIGL